MRKCDVGGQAVIEGVMMRGSKGIATAIRTSKGNIKVSVKKTVPLTKKYKILSLPFIRGITALLDSLIIGIKTLNYSASFFEDEEEESAFEKWIKNKFGEKFSGGFYYERIYENSRFIALYLYARRTWYGRCGGNE